MPCFIIRFVIAFSPITDALQCGCIAKIPPVYIVNVAVSIVINAVGSNFARVPPKLIAKLRMFSIDTAINNCYYHG